MASSDLLNPHPLGADRPTSEDLDEAGADQTLDSSAEKRVALPKPDTSNITVLTESLPNEPILPWHRFDSPWLEKAETPDEIAPDAIAPDAIATSETADRVNADSTNADSANNGSSPDGSADQDEEQLTLPLDASDPDQPSLPEMHPELELSTSAEAPVS